MKLIQRIEDSDTVIEMIKIIIMQLGDKYQQLGTIGEEADEAKLEREDAIAHLKVLRSLVLKMKGTCTSKIVEQTSARVRGSGDPRGNFHLFDQLRNSPQMAPSIHNKCEKDEAREVTDVIVLLIT